jgi:hypothetical protein
VERVLGRVGLVKELEIDMIKNAEVWIPITELINNLWGQSHLDRPSLFNDAGCLSAFQDGDDVFRQLVLIVVEPF